MAIGTIQKASGASDYVAGNKKYRRRIVQLTSGANYATGGELITPAMVGFSKTINTCLPEGLALTTSGTTSRSVGFIHQPNGDVRMLVHTTASGEATGSSDQSTFFVRVLFVGV